MSDPLLDNPSAIKLIKALGLPIPVPERLSRAKGPYEERPIDDARVLVGGRGALGPAIAEAVIQAGGEPLFMGDAKDAIAYERAGEAWGRPLTLVTEDDAAEAKKVDCVVFDATGIVTADGLHDLYDFFHPWMYKIAKSGRVVILTRPVDALESVEAAAAAAGIEGFTRSLAKEIGATGATANSVFVEEGAEDRIDPLLRFLLSPRSAYVTAQPFRLSKTAAGQDAPRTRPLDGKVVLLTGAARGIGAATAEILAREGAHVVCLDRPADDGPTSKVARAIGGSTLLVDITDEDAPQRIGHQLLERHGGVDVVIHNAGVTRDKTLARMKPELWDMTVDINLGAVMRITRFLIDDGVLHDGGRIVCLSSVSGIAGNRGQTNYSASKAGIVGFVRALAPEVASRGITVNAVAPGFIETRLTAAMPVPIREAARRLSALGQGGKPEDVGQAVTFLSTPGSVGVTGSVHRVCGGALVGA